MRVLIDENLPTSVGGMFRERGFAVTSVGEHAKLRGKPDEIIFEYAVQTQAIIVTRDLRFANPTRFPLHKLSGIVALRFPNDVSIAGLCNEARRLMREFREEDFRQLVVIEPGSVRMRPLS